MTFVRAHMYGAKELDRALAGLDTAVATSIGIRANRKAANYGRDQIKAAAPYDPTYRLKTWKLKSGQTNSAYYGHLRDNIKVRKARSKQKNYVVFNITTGKAFWGYFREFGTVNMPARPWARPAVERMGGEVVAIQGRELGEGIEAYARKAAKAGGRALLPNGRNA